MSDLAEKTYGGGTPTTSNEAYWNGDIPWIQSSDVVDGKLLGVEPRKWITQDGLNNSAAQLIPGNSIAIITRVGVGKLAFMPYSYATSQDFLSLSKLNAEPLFTVYACYKKLQSELNAVQGTSIKGITKDELLAKNIMVPRYAEQQQIGAFFKQLDHLITLHQRECISFTGRADRLILTANKKRTTSSWEQRKLGELCNITTGKLDANAMVSDGQYDFYTSGIDVFKIDVAAFEGPAITIAGNGASVGYMHLADGKFNAYQRTYVLTDFLADRQFLNVAIGNELPNKIQEEVRGSGIPYIVLNMLTDLALPFPSHEEQYAIGVYFQQLDNLITLHQRKPFLMKWRTSDANRNQTNRLVL